MIKKIRLRGFKKFAKQKFEIPGHLVVTGPNNSGKTTLLQAVGAWMEVAFRWSQNNPDLARESDGNYSAINITVDSFSSIPLADFDHLWTGKKTQEPVAVWLETERWNIGFEFLHEAQVLLAGRPAAETKEEELAAMRDDFLDLPGKSDPPWKPVYIPAVSGVGPKEHRLADQEAIQSYLAKANAGSILRNLLWQVQENEESWHDLNKAVGKFFPGYEMLPISPGEYLRAQYRCSSKEVAYDLSSAASGFLQVLLIYASIIGRSSAVYLLDEPDAHLHISLQNKLLEDLLERAEQGRFQIIAATHSECLVRGAPEDCLHLLDVSGNLKKVPGAKAVAVLKLDPVEIVEALRESRFLYLEGTTDIKFLRVWAKILDHPCLPILEQATLKTTAQREDKERLAVKHFTAIQEIVPEARGAELLDGDQHSGDRDRPEGLELEFWSRKEIESYLLHPASVSRYLRSSAFQGDAAKAQKYMEDQLPRRFLKEPHGESPFLEQLPIKDFFSALFQEAGLQQVTTGDLLRIAGEMKKEEIPKEVCDKLDWIAKHLGVQESGPEAA